MQEKRTEAHLYYNDYNMENTRKKEMVSPKP